MDVRLIADDETPDQEYSEPILRIQSVVPLRQPVRINDDIHEMRSIYEFGVIARHEIQRDWDRYRGALTQIEAGRVITDDDAILADLALQRILSLSMPTVSSDQWEGVDSADKEALANLFFSLNMAQEQARQDQQAAYRSTRSITAH